MDGINKEVTDEEITVIDTNKNETISLDNSTISEQDDKITVVQDSTLESIKQDETICLDTSTSSANDVNKTSDSIKENETIDLDTSSTVDESGASGNTVTGNSSDKHVINSTIDLDTTENEDSDINNKSVDNPVTSDTAINEENCDKNSKVTCSNDAINETINLDSTATSVEFNTSCVSDTGKTDSPNDIVMENNSDEMLTSKPDLGIFPAERPVIKSMEVEEKENEMLTSKPEDLGIFPAERPVIRSMKVEEKDNSSKSSLQIKRKKEDDDIVMLDAFGLSLDIDGDISIAKGKSTVPYPVNEIPKYETITQGFLADIEYDMDTGKKINDDPRPKKCCFNCLGDHNVPDCQEPLNQQVIAVNRKKMMSKRVSSVRFFEDNENKFGTMRPGRISDKLREALGLRWNDLPCYIYRMRAIGYPPGWLMEAEVRQTDLKMFDSTGQSVSHPDNEEGETEAAVKYNPDKLVSYPGFNVPIPRGFRDDWRYYNSMPMQYQHNKSEFRRFMEQNRAGSYKKRKLADDGLKSNSNLDSSAASTDMEDSVLTASDEPDEPMPPASVKEPQSSTSNPKDLEDGELFEEDSLTSIDQLEAKREALLKQLNDSSSVSCSSEIMKAEDETDQKVTENGNEASVDSEMDNKATSVDEDEDTTQSSISLNAESENSNNSSNVEGQKKKKLKHEKSQSKEMSLGVPIPESITPFNQLPEFDKWAVDIIDHINFENLPDALGTWKKMKGLVKRIRKNMTALEERNELDDAKS